MSEYKFDEFKILFEQKMREFKDEVASFNWENKECYAKWCAHTYFYVRHSTRLLAYGASRAELDQETLHRRLVSHLSEEKGHEKLVLNDMKIIGVSVDEYRELPATALFYQNQYYWLNFHGAIPFFGWILALEGGAVHTCATAYARVAKTHGASAGSFLKVHAEEDVGHLDKALDVIKDLSGQELFLVAQNFEQSCELYFNVLGRIGREAAIKKTAA
jgi:pyrroloquinoline quinone (PQQ) biosynthesis protein C